LTEKNITDTIQFNTITVCTALVQYNTIQVDTCQDGFEKRSKDDDPVNNLEKQWLTAKVQLHERTNTAGIVDFHTVSHSISKKKHDDQCYIQIHSERRTKNRFFCSVLEINVSCSRKLIEVRWSSRSRHNHSTSTVGNRFVDVVSQNGEMNLVITQGRGWTNLLIVHAAIWFEC